MAFKDPTGTITKLGSAYTSQYDGYPTPVYKSAWASYKSKTKGITVGVDLSAPVTPTQAALVPDVQNAIKAIPGVKKVVLLTMPQGAVPTQLQQVHELLEQHVNYLVVEPQASPPLIALAQAAKKAGIPFISILGSVPTPDSINLAPNSVADGLSSGALLAKEIGGKGLVLGVHAVPSTSVDEQEFSGWSTAFKRCPGITFDTSLVGDFSPSVAESQVASYLSSHPQPVAGVVETAGMTSGIIQAFQQAGRPVPRIVDVGPSVGDFVYFKGHLTNLAEALTLTPSGLAKATAFTIKEMISGHDPKISELSSLSKVFVRNALSTWIPSGASSTDAAVPEGAWLPSTYLAPFFGTH